MTRRCLALLHGCLAELDCILPCSSSRQCCAVWLVQFSHLIPTRTIHSHLVAANLWIKHEIWANETFISSSESTNLDDRIQQSCTFCLKSRYIGCFHARFSAWWIHFLAVFRAKRHPCSVFGRCFLHQASRLPSSWSPDAPTRRNMNERHLVRLCRLHDGHD